jgi:PAB1-binding protein PBP1
MIQLHLNKVTEKIKAKQNRSQGNKETVSNRVWKTDSDIAENPRRIRLRNVLNLQSH